MNYITKIALPEKVSAVIKTFIDDFEASALREKMTFGEDYYRSKNTVIMKRQMLIYAEDEDGNPYEMNDPYKANYRLPGGYLKILVDQKVNYLLGKPITYEGDDAEELEETLGRDFQTLLMQAAKESCKKVTGWIHPYIDEKGELKFSTVPSEQVIAVYSPTDRTQIDVIIRYYVVTVMNDNNEAIKVTRVEVWDKDEVTYYQETDRGGIYRLMTAEQMTEVFGRKYPNPKYHFQKNLVYGSSTAKTEGVSWGAIPFIPLYNNDEEEYDLQAVKPFIDAYDVINSDFCNNLEDFQDVYWILKGYDGENLAQFLYQVKRYKTLKVADDGDARAERIDIPYEARKEAKESLERDIFTFGMGVNPNAIGDGNITNVVIRSRFALLDLKCSQFALEIKDCLFALLDFINKYRELKNMKPLVIDDIIFNRSIIVNEIELLDANTQQITSISEQTRLSNHPWVDDVEEELARMAEAEAERVDLDGVVDDEPTDES